MVHADSHTTQTRSDTVAFQFVESSCVSVGTFNIYLIHPKLLMEMGVIESGQQARISGDFTQPGMKLSLDGEIESEWVIRPERFSVTSKNAMIDCGSLVGKVLDKLPWTPINAIGINFQFRCDGHTILDSFKFQLPETSQSCVQRTAHFGVKKDNYQINIQVTAVSETDKEYVTITLNNHFDFGGIRKNHPQLAMSEQISEICKQFDDYRKESVKVASEIIGLELE